jgi:hypothetical protein
VSPPGARWRPADGAAAQSVVTGKIRQAHGTRQFEITEAAVRVEAVATVLTADVLDRGSIDGSTAEWAITLLDRAGWWLTRAAA